MKQQQMLAGPVLTVVGPPMAAPCTADGNPDAVFFDDSEVVSVEYPTWFKLNFMDLRRKPGTSHKYRLAQRCSVAVVRQGEQQWTGIRERGLVWHMVPAAA